MGFAGERGRQLSSGEATDRNGSRKRPFGHRREPGLRFAATGQDLEALGRLVPNHRIRQAALAVARAHASMRLLCDAQVTSLQREPGSAQVRLADGRPLRARLVVATDSRFPPLRCMAGIGTSVRNFARSVVVGRVWHEGANDSISWECFRYGNTLALLPLNAGMSSAVAKAATTRQLWGS